MNQAPSRERADLARSAITMRMDGPKKSAKFGLLRKGDYVGVSVVHNTLSKFAKLAVGKHVVTAKQRHTGDQIFPLTVAPSGFNPISKVTVTYEPQPKNTFKFSVNGEDIYSLVKEEVDFDPSKTEKQYVFLNLNDKKDSNGYEGVEWAIFGSMPWIIDEAEEKIQTCLGMDRLSSIFIWGLDCKSWVANEFLDLLTCYDLQESGLDKLKL